MPKIRYESINMKPETRAIIAQADTIARQYQAQRYDLTLRQLYYRFIARDLFPESWIDRAYNKREGLDPETKNTVKNYKRLGDMVQKGRRAGLIDWSTIVDRTRNLDKLAMWVSAQSATQALADQFRYDRWLTQSTYVEVWYEKDALMGIFERVAQEFRIPSFSCRGYTSDSEIWSAAQRLRHVGKGTDELFPEGIEAHPRDVMILHFGDHDPSGLDMTRDIGDRLRLFGAPRNLDIRRLALNMDQVEQYTPPPNPAKETDSRYANYAAEFGDESWELDALEPDVLSTLVSKELLSVIDVPEWNEEVGRERRTRAELTAVTEQYPTVVSVVEEYIDEASIALDGREEIEEDSGDE